MGKFISKFEHQIEVLGLFRKSFIKNMIVCKILLLPVPVVKSFLHLVLMTARYKADILYFPVKAPAFVIK